MSAKERDIKDEIFELLRSDYELRKKISEKLGKRETAVRAWAEKGRMSFKQVGHYKVIKIIKEHAKLKDEDIFIR